MAAPIADPSALIVATAELIGDGRTARARFGIAVSGGPDSLALLLLAAAAFPGRVESATFDHGLRPESAKEAATVADICAGLGLPHGILTPSAPIVGSMQAEARHARYAALECWRIERGIDWLMTAHHADDQLETLVLRLNRGSGLAGLSGIRARNGAVLRPLLGWRRETLADVVRRAGLVAVDDPSNRDNRFDRARIRKALADCDAIDPLAAARSAAHLAQAEEALDWTAALLAESRITSDGATVALDSAGLPAELLRRLLMIALRSADPALPEPRGDALTRAIAAARAGQKTMLGNLLLGPARDTPGRWHISPAPARR